MPCWAFCDGQPRVPISKIQCSPRLNLMDSRITASCDRLRCFAGRLHEGPPLLPGTILKFNILRSNSATCLKRLFSVPIPQKHKRWLFAPKQQRLANEPPRFSMAAFCFTCNARHHSFKSLVLVRLDYSFRFASSNGITRWDSRYHRPRNRQHARARASGRRRKRSAATHWSVTVWEPL